MADTGHSVLLKFFIDTSKMSEIESNVPKTQELRGDINAVDRGHAEESVYSPVITITEQETTTIKEDLTVKRVVVTEDVSDVSITVKEERVPEKDSSQVFVSVTREEATYVTNTGDGDKDDINNNPKQTRIPKLNFKQAVDKIKNEEQVVQDKTVHEPILGMKVRSSIPRLKEAKLLAIKSELNGDEKKENSKKLDDEFDKIYEEIKDSNTDVSIPTPESMRDAEIVDSIFEEIIHAYDENVETSKQQSSTEKVKSKIPLLKRKSEQEILVAPVSNRRGSLKKSNSVDESKIPVHTKSVITKDLDSIKANNAKIYGSYSISKSESVTDKKTESFEMVKTIKSQKSIETDHVHVSSGEVTIVKSNETSKIPVKSHMKEKIETKLSSVTLNRLPVRKNITEKILNQNVDTGISTSSISQTDIKVEKNNNTSQSVTREIVNDYEVGKLNTDVLSNNEEKLINEQIIKTNQENIFTSKTEEKIINTSTNNVTRTISIESKEVGQHISTSTNESLSVIASQLESALTQTKELSTLNVNIDTALSENVKTKELTNEETKMNKTDNVKNIDKVKENVNVTTVGYDSSIDLKTEVINNTKLVEENRNSSNAEHKTKDLVNIPTGVENNSTTMINTKANKDDGNNKESDVNLKEAKYISIINNDNQNKLTFNKKELIERNNVQKTIQSIETVSASIVKNDKLNNNLIKIENCEGITGKPIEVGKNKFENNKEQHGDSEIIKNDNLVINNIQTANKEINETGISNLEHNVTNFNIDIESDSDKLKLDTDNTTVNVNSKSITSQIKNIEDLDEEDIIVLKGKVNRIISRLDSREVRVEKIEDDIPRNVSVVSNVAIFERNVPEHYKHDLDDQNPENEKPIIVDEILKPKQNNIYKKNIVFNENKQENTFDYYSVYNKVHSSVLRRLKSIETKTNINHNEQTDKQTKINTKETNINEEDEETEKLNTETGNVSRQLLERKSLKNYDRTKSLAELHFNETRNDNENVFDSKFKKFNEERRAKSLAELDLGDVVKGRVKQMVLRMNSIEKESRERRVFERCRSRGTVLSRAAVFEKKVVPVRAEENVTRIEKTSIIPTVSEEELKERIEELSLARSKYGQYENIPSIELRDGTTMPVIAVGTALLEPKLVKHIVSAAIDLGYRAFDTAFIYGNEKEIGDAIRSKIEDGTVKREDLFIISKLWSTFHRRDLVETACQDSLQTMGLEYFDLYMIHNPMSFREGPNPIPKIANVLQYSQHDYLEAWYGMEAVATSGLAKRIGLSNFNSAQVDRILDKAKIKPVINQVECHPYLNQHNLEDFCAIRNIKLSCFGVLGSKGTPLELKSGNSSVIDDPLVQVMAAGLGVTPAQLLIAYQLFHNRNVVVKSSTGAHLWDNLLALNVKLDQAQVSALDALNKNKRAFTFKGMGDTHKNYPFKTAF